MKKYLLIATCFFVTYNAAAGIIMGVAKGAAIGYAAHKGAQYLEDKDKEKNVESSSDSKNNNSYPNQQKNPFGQSNQNVVPSKNTIDTPTNIVPTKPAVSSTANTQLPANTVPSFIEPNKKEPTNPLLNQ